jgi:ribosome modulation factor
MTKPKTAIDSSGLTNEERLAALREVAAFKRTIDEATGAYRALLKRFKAEGFDTAALLAVIVASRQDPAIVQAHETERLRLFALRDIISLSEVMEAADNLSVTTSAKHADHIGAAQEAGYRAGKNGVPREDCPYPGASEFSHVWSEWHGKGMLTAGAKKMANASRREPENDDGVLQFGAPKKRRGRPPAERAAREAENAQAM